MTLAAAILTAVITMVPAAPAESRLKVGIGDQNPETFSERDFRRLRVKRTRYIVPWDIANTREGRKFVNRWYKAARRRKLEIMVAFGARSTDRCPARPCRAPSTRSYKRAIRNFMRRYKFVRWYQPWNESNSRTQPTTGRRGARKVAAYYKILRRECRRKRGRRRCDVTGADIQDIGAFTAYAREFLRRVGRRQRPKVMGFHNYTDTNRRRTKNTARFVRAMPRGVKVWLTETGGIYSFTQQDGTVSLPPSENRAARSMSHMYRIAKSRRFRRKIDRIYIYQWKINFIGDRFDAGIMNPDGSRRKSYRVVFRNRKYFR